MNNLIRLNFKYLIKDQGKKTELFQKLKQGQDVNARVSSYENGKALINIKGTDVLAFVNRELVKGEMVKLHIDELNKDSLLMSVVDEKNSLVKSENSLLNESSLKSEVLSEALNDKIYLDDEKSKNIIKKYKKYREKFGTNKKNLLKTLIFLEDSKIKDSEKAIENLVAYFEKKSTEKLTEKEDIKNKLKEILAKTESKEENETKKGQELLNSINKLREKNELEFITGFYSENEKAKIKIKYEKKDETGKIQPENLYISINLNLENLGDLDINLNIWNKKIDLIFLMEKGFEKKEILKNIEKLKDRIKKTGYVISDVKVRTKDKKEYNLKGVNLKV